MSPIDLTGMRAFIAGIAEHQGYGWAIARALAQAGATLCAGTWPPALSIFTKSLERGKLDVALPGGGAIAFEKVYPLDASFDTAADVPPAVAEDKRYRELGAYSIQGVADALSAEHGGPCLDILVHSLANGPEVRNPLLATSRAGYLAAIGTSAYSLVSMVARFGPLFREGASVISLSYLAGQRAVPGYGGGMSSAKAALESDTRTMAYEAGRGPKRLRVNAISAGPLASRAARAIGMIDKSIALYERVGPLRATNTAADVGHAAAFLCSPLAAGITGQVVFVDCGYSAMGTPGDDDAT